MKNVISLLIISLAVMLVACEREVPFSSNERKDLTIETRHDAFVEKGKEFSFNLLREYYSINANGFVVSPLSIELVLGMINYGAQGQSSGEICSALGYGYDEKKNVAEYANSLSNQLVELDKSTLLYTANGVFISDKYHLTDYYSEGAKEYYSADAMEMDFNDILSAKKTINEIIKKKTNSKIPNALENLKGGIEAIFLNAVYFEGQWSSKFDKKKTKEHPFITDSGNVRKVNLMNQKNYFRYYKSDSFATAVLPYGNGAFNMVIALPNNGYSVESIIEEMDSEKWNEIIRKADAKELDLYIPKFKIEYTNDNLIPVMNNLGIESIFNDTADLSLIANGFNNCISHIGQSILLDVDESGTKATIKTKAISGVIANDIPKTFKADHPFVYFLMEKSTGIILLEGVFSGE